LFLVVLALVCLGQETKRFQRMMVPVPSPSLALAHRKGAWTVRSAVQQSRTALLLLAVRAVGL
jgi:hypothetical protein